MNLSSLNPQQREAVTHTEGPLLILAGAGTGKTRTLVTRAAYIVDQGLASPHTLLLLTFTRKAAAELRERLQELLEEDIEGLNVGTFHSLCYRILNAERRDSADPLKVLSETQALRKLDQVMKQLNVKKGRWSLKGIAQAINRAKDRLVGPEGFVSGGRDFYTEAVAEMYRHYQEALQAEGAVDFADLQWLTIRLLEQDEEARAFYQEMSRYILVDEFQDTSAAQYRLLELLSGKYGNLCCVGSPSQAIYSWRGADVELILSRFREDHPEARVIVLQKNYRNTPPILSAAQRVIRPLGYEDALLQEPEKEGGVDVVVRRVQTDREEAAFVAEEILRLREELDTPWSQFAVLFRTNRQGRAVERVFLQREIPYTLAGATTFFRQMEIADLLAYLRLAVDPTHPGALDRIINKPPRGIGPVTCEQLREGNPQVTMEALLSACEREDIRAPAREAIQKLTRFLYQELWQKQQELSPPDLLDYILTQTDYGQWVRDDVEGEERWANVQGLKEMAAPYDRPGQTAEFLQDLSLDWDATFEDRWGVTLSTVHQAKGLEFEVVLVIGMAEGILPHAKVLRNNRDPEEERRLCYVALSRAKEREYLLWPASRLSGGEWVTQHPSRYLEGMLRKEKKHDTR